MNPKKPNASSAYLQGVHFNVFSIVIIRKSADLSIVYADFSIEVLAVRKNSAVPFRYGGVVIDVKRFALGAAICKAELQVKRQNQSCQTRPSYTPLKGLFPRQ